MLTTTSHRERTADRMLADLSQRFASVSIDLDGDRWVCVLSGSAWSTAYRGASRFDALDAAHASYYWPQD